MRYFLRVDAGGFIHGYTGTDGLPEGSDWLEQPGPVFGAMGAEVMRLLPDGSIVGSGHSRLPPSIDMVWDEANGGWIDTRDLAEKKVAKWATFKEQREAEETSPFVWNGLTFDADRVSQARIQGAVQLAMLDAGFTVDWTLADNTTVTLTGPEMMGVGGALGVHVTAAHVKGRTVRDLINGALDEAGLNSITWPV